MFRKLGRERSVVGLRREERDIPFKSEKQKTFNFLTHKTSPSLFFFFFFPFFFFFFRHHAKTKRNLFYYYSSTLPPWSRHQPTTSSCTRQPWIPLSLP